MATLCFGDVTVVEKLLRLEFRVSVRPAANKESRSGANVFDDGGSSYVNGSWNDKH